MPEVSVLVGTLYRRQDVSLLKRSIQSILRQTIADIEVLICDDGSGEEARQLLDVLAEQDKRIMLVRRGDLLTLPQKLNACIEKAQGKWLARMDDDDYAEANRFERQIAYLKTHPEIAFVGCNARLTSGGKAQGVWIFPPSPEVKDFYFTQPFLHPAIMFRREAVEDVGGYSEDQYCILCEDYDLFLRLYAAGHRGANIQEFLMTYTISETNKGGRKMCHRWNETVTRYRRFKELGLWPKTFPYVIKPLLVGMLPGKLLYALKSARKRMRGEIDESGIDDSGSNV